VLWLLVAFVPALLMLAAHGLSRLEAELVGETVSARDVANFVEHARAAEVRTLARAGMPEALDDMNRRRTEWIAGESAIAFGPPNGRHKHPERIGSSVTRRINPV
jgi:hypothetical protein